MDQDTAADTLRSLARLEERVEERKRSAWQPLVVWAVLAFNAAVLSEIVVLLTGRVSSSRRFPVPGGGIIEVTGQSPAPAGRVAIALLVYWIIAAPVGVLLTRRQFNKLAVQRSHPAPRPDTTPPLIKFVAVLAGIYFAGSLLIFGVAVLIGFAQGTGSAPLLIASVMAIVAGRRYSNPALVVAAVGGVPLIIASAFLDSQGPPAGALANALLFLGFGIYLWVRDPTR